VSAASPYLAVGNCTLDDVVTPDGQISPRQLGGNAVYASAGMRLWGAEVSLVSVVGCDYPSTWLEQLAGAGIDVSAIVEIPDPHLLRSRAFYFADGSRTDRIEEAHAILPAHAGEIIDLESEYTDTGSPLHRRIWPSFCPDLTQFANLAEKASFVHLAPGPLPCSRANANFLKELKGDQVIITFDWPWWDWDREDEVDFALLKSIDYLLPSIEELTIHADAAINAASEGKADQGHVFEAARRLLALGPRGIGVKMGHADCACCCKERRTGFRSRHSPRRPSIRPGPAMPSAAAFWSGWPRLETPGRPPFMARSRHHSSLRTLACFTP